MGLRYPIENGIITNWDNMEVIWINTYRDRLRVTFEEHPLLMTESPLNSDENREQMTQLFFRVLNAPALAIRTTAELALYATNRTTGVVIDFGCNVTHVVPVCEGVIIKDVVQLLDIGG